MVDPIAQLCLSYFLCEFDPRSKRRLTKEVVKEIALQVYSSERVDEFLDTGLLNFQAMLVEEFNTRYQDKRPLRFQIVDSAGIGSMVAGYQPAKIAQEIRFQNSLHSISPADFERLTAIVLRIVGCDNVFSTPASHDQGVDAFGQKVLVAPTPYGVTHTLTWIAQAKHYKRTLVTTGDVRELVGSKELLLAKVFSTIDERYKELRLRIYAPTAMALVTTEEIPTTVRRLADVAGIYIFASSDLFHLLGPILSKLTVGALRAFIKKEAIGIPVLD
jgi:Restriction endonuclease